MARGWESKSIEAQQDDAARAKAPGGRRPTAEERERAAARRTLELARAKVREDLRRATTRAHREMLQRALEDLDRQLRVGESG
jgi:hypothetical protein